MVSNMVLVDRYLFSVYISFICVFSSVCFAGTFDLQYKMINFIKFYIDCVMYMFVKISVRLAGSYSSQQCKHFFFLNDIYVSLF